MKFVDDLYEYYKESLTTDDDEEDIDLLVGSILQELSREDLLHLLSELSYDELYKLTGTYIANALRKKRMRDWTANKQHFYH
ncbi:DUF6154 family protein [Fervidibacillus halotolerans]|uniref:DUF6154 family protein n=1 Tax=Fervidibacillus halotolerans TaxID=2980027 RepID=A0A9E8RWI4_9BACI|nr:DUF6154 family protein [Fervidibacillus halotolerans]WAA11790.1 DUF6154 family protein [Fervidibacillus halotolerans]